MPWHSNRFSQFASLLGLSVCIDATWGVDESRLWLAKSQHKYFLSLVQAAQVAETLERCSEVLEGTLDREQSAPNHPIFRVLCRQPNGRSYNEMVDGLSFETLTTPKPVVVELTPEELEQLRRQQEERERQQTERRHDRFWQLCEAALSEKTRMMIDLAWLTQGRPEPASFDSHSASFAVDFNARSVWGEPLKFRANCIAGDAIDTQADISRRAN